MIKEQLAKRIDSIAKDAARFEEAIHVLGASVERFPEEYGALHADAVRRGEWLVCRLRHLLYETAVIKKQDYLLQAAEAQGISLQNRDGVFQMTLPGIVFDNSRKRPSEFLADPLYAALAAYFRNYPVPRYHHCVVAYALMFDREVCGKVSLDTSNLELKRYLDIAAAYLLIDDSPKYIDAYYSVELCGRHAVEMSFMEKGRFSQWLREREETYSKSKL